MNHLSNIDSNNYVTIQNQYGVINQGTGYAIVNIQTKQTIAQNISSFLDCVKTLEYLSGNSQSNYQSNQNHNSFDSVSFNRNFGVKPDVHQVIMAYAPSTARVEKKTNSEGARYKCYDQSDNYLGQVRGKVGNRYWKDSSGIKHY